MKDFFKTLFASCLGVVLAIVGIIFIFFIIGSVSMMGSKSKVSDEGVLAIELDHYIPELTDNVETQQFSLDKTVTIGLRHVIRLIKNAETDSKIKALVIKADNPMNGGATLLAISNAVQEFKKTDKPVYAYINSTGRNGYLLASIADKVYMNPNGGISLNGYGTTMPFLKGMMDKLGIKFNIFYAGDFKSATEPLRRTDMSPENKLQTREFLNEYLETLQNIVCANRKLTKDQLTKIMVELEGRNPELALKAGLIDKVAYQDEFETELRKVTSMSDKDKINYISLDSYAKNNVLIEKGSYSNKIAVVYAEGDVVYGSNQKGVITDQKYIKLLNKIRNDDKIKAVVLRVNSGGGSAFTSDVIWRELELIKKAGKPVVASFGDYAASGGYYIAAGADKIFAYPNTLTGSIGVFSILPNTKELMNNKLGITFDTVQTLANSISLPSNYDLSAKDNEIMQEATIDIYETFCKRVADGRKLPIEKVKEIARGRVWTGDKAVEIGLVDKIGSLDDAVKEAAKLAKVSDFKIAEYPYIKADPFAAITEAIASGSSDDEDAKLAKTLISQFVTSSDKRMITEIIQRRKEGLIQARIPFVIQD